MKQGLFLPGERRRQKQSIHALTHTHLQKKSKK
jgi:hypothetical protein